MENGYAQFTSFETARPQAWRDPRAPHFSLNLPDDHGCIILKHPIWKTLWI